MDDDQIRKLYELYRSGVISQRTMMEAVGLYDRHVPVPREEPKKEPLPEVLHPGDPPFRDGDLIHFARTYNDREVNLTEHPELNGRSTRYHRFPNPPGKCWTVIESAYCAQRHVWWFRLQGSDLSESGWIRHEHTNMGFVSRA